MSSFSGLYDAKTSTNDYKFIEKQNGWPFAFYLFQNIPDIFEVPCIVKILEYAGESKKDAELLLPYLQRLCYENNALSFDLPLNYSEESNLPEGFIVLANGQIIKYDYEIDGIYYFASNLYVKNSEIQKLQPQEKTMDTTSDIPKRKHISDIPALHFTAPLDPADLLYKMMYFLSQKYWPICRN